MCLSYGQNNRDKPRKCMQYLPHAVHRPNSLAQAPRYMLPGTCTCCCCFWVMITHNTEFSWALVCNPVLKCCHIAYIFHSGHLVACMSCAPHTYCTNWTQLSEPKKSLARSHNPPSPSPPSPPPKSSLSSPPPKPPKPPPVQPRQQLQWESIAQNATGRVLMLLPCQHQGCRSLHTRGQVRPELYSILGTEHHSNGFCWR